MLPDLYKNKPRDFIIDEGHCAISHLKEKRIDYRAVVPNADPQDDIKTGMQIIRMLEEKENLKTPTGKYFIIIVHEIITRSFGELHLDENFIAMTAEKDASAWAHSMQRAYAQKRNALGELAFPDGLHIHTPFTVYWFTPIMTATAQEFLMAQYLYYEGNLPPQIHTEWERYYGKTAIKNVIRKIKKQAQ